MQSFWNRLKTNSPLRHFLPFMKKVAHNLRPIILRLLHPDRRLMVFTHDFLVPMVALQLAFGLYYGDNLVYFSEFFMEKQMLTFGLLCAGFFTWFQIYRYVWKYTNFKSLFVLWTAIAFATLCYWPIATKINIENIKIPSLLIAGVGLMTVALATFSRIVYRFGYLRWIMPEDKDFADKPTARILLVGMHSAHIDLFSKSLAADQDGGIECVGIITEKPQNLGKTICGIEVIGLFQDLVEIIEDLNAQGTHPHHVVITSDFYKGEKLRALMEMLKPYHISLKKFSSFKPGASAHELLPITLEDIYYAPVYLDDQTDLAVFYQDKTIMITGAAGELGPVVCQQLLTMGVRKLIVCDSSHYALASLKENLSVLAGHCEIHYVLTFQYTVEKYQRLLKQYSVDTIFYMEGMTEEEVALENPIETIVENILTPKALVEMARAAGVKYFALPSFATLENYGMITHSNRLSLRWCDYENAKSRGQNKGQNADLKVLSIPLPHLLSPDARWIQKLRHALGAHKSVHFVLNQEHIPLMTPERAAFSFLKTLFVAHMSQHSSGVLMEESPHRVNFTTLLHHIHGIYPLDLDAIHWSVDPLCDPIKMAKTLVFDTESYTYEGQPLDVKGLDKSLDALEKAAQSFDTSAIKTALESIH